MCGGSRSRELDDAREGRASARPNRLPRERPPSLRSLAVLVLIPAAKSAALMNAAQPEYQRGCAKIFPTGAAQCAGLDAGNGAVSFPTGARFRPRSEEEVLDHSRLRTVCTQLSGTDLQALQPYVPSGGLGTIADFARITANLYEQRLLAEYCGISHLTKPRF
jgi:hypothetical protein